jgi:DNA-binding LacI/PurR family transcriptional regulator
MAEKKSTVNLRTVAERVGLAPCSVSAILNNTPASHVIPQTTKDRVILAAAELNYRPNLWARSLRTKRTRMVAAIAPDFGSAAVARVIAGAQRSLQKKSYLLVLGTDNFSEPEHNTQFQQRGIEGVIAINLGALWQTDLPLASVDLDYTPSLDALTQSDHSRLAAMGESAAETIIRQIEQSDVPRRVTVEAIPVATRMRPASWPALTTSMAAHGGA